MVRSKCPSRKRRSQRRLLKFLLREAVDGKQIKVDIIEISRTLLGETPRSTENLVKFPENRLVSAIATVERTTLSVSEEGNIIVAQIMEELENGASVLKTTVSSERRPTINGSCEESTYRYLLIIVLKEEIRESSLEKKWNVV